MTGRYTALRLLMPFARLIVPLGFTVLLAAPAAAQSPDAPPGPFAVDARIAMPSFNTGSAVADPLGLRTAKLPNRASVRRSCARRAASRPIPTIRRQ